MSIQAPLTSHFGLEISGAQPPRSGCSSTIRSELVWMSVRFAAVLLPSRGPYAVSGAPHPVAPVRHRGHPLTRGSDREGSPPMTDDTSATRRGEPRSEDCSVFARAAGHEQVVFCHDGPTGLKAIIAIYSTALGPALGGTRFYPYATEQDALEDVLNLSRGMAYKAALAGLDLGGGKAVIIGDPAQHKTEALLRAYGRFVQSLNGRYYTACDVGPFSEDMDHIARECSFVTGRTVAHGGAGDSSVLTAYGVFQGMRAAAEVTWGRPALEGRTVGVAGVGKVGRHLVTHLVEDGARVVVTDVDSVAVAAVQQAHPDVRIVPDVDALITDDLDVYAPCALGGALDDAVVG